MKQFVYLYFGGRMPANDKEAKKVMDEWMAWFGTLGKNLVQAGAPLGERKTLGSAAGSGATGYCVVQAADLKAAIAMAKTCPAIAAGDGLEILEAVPAKM